MASGVPFTAQTAGNGNLVAMVGTDTLLVPLGVLPSELDHLDILDSTGTVITGLVTVTEGSRTQFEARGVDLFGNIVAVQAVWTADANLGAIQGQRLLYALDGTGSGGVTASAGGVSGRANVAVLQRLLYSDYYSPTETSLQASIAVDGAGNKLLATYETDPDVGPGVVVISQPSTPDVGVTETNVSADIFGVDITTGTLAASGSAAVVALSGVSTEFGINQVFVKSRVGSAWGLLGNNLAVDPNQQQLWPVPAIVNGVPHVAFAETPYVDQGS